MAKCNWSNPSQELKDNAENEMVIMLVANKLDLKHLRQVSTDIGAAYA